MAFGASLALQEFFRGVIVSRRPGTRALCRGRGLILPYSGFHDLDRLRCSAHESRLFDRAEEKGLAAVDHGTPRKEIVRVLGVSQPTIRRP